jgi:hypothetical protein
MLTRYVLMHEYRRSSNGEVERTADQTTGDQRAEHERRARSTNVQELPVERVVPPGRLVHRDENGGYLLSHLNFSTNNNNDSHRQLEGTGVMSERAARTIVVQHMGTQIPIQVSCRACILGNHMQFVRQGRYLKIYGGIDSVRQLPQSLAGGARQMDSACRSASSGRELD